jgi:outer membrane protein assembly factor BamD
MHARRTTWLTLAAALLLGACASRGPAFDQMDADALFDYGMERLERRRWSDADAAFQRLLLQFPDHPRVPEARFRVGETYMGRREYVTAALEFNRLAVEFPAGPWADDARFQVCRAYHELAPPKQLDQEYTFSAIDHCNSLIAYYPDSEFVPRAREIVEELTNRLAEKEYDIAESYFRKNAFDSANLYYIFVADNYSGTTWAPRALLRLYQVYQRLEYEPEMRAARERLIREYPDSPEARQVGGAAAGS